MKNKIGSIYYEHHNDINKDELFLFHYKIENEKNYLVILGPYYKIHLYQTIFISFFDIIYVTYRNEKCGLYGIEITHKIKQKKINHIQSILDKINKMYPVPKPNEICSIIFEYSLFQVQKIESEDRMYYKIKVNDIQLHFILYYVFYMNHYIMDEMFYYTKQIKEEIYDSYDIQKLIIDIMIGYYNRFFMHIYSSIKNHTTLHTFESIKNKFMLLENITNIELDQLDSIQAEYYYQHSYCFILPSNHPNILFFIKNKMIYHISSNDINN